MNRNTEIKALGDISPDHLYGAFSEAFKDYEMQLDQDGLERMLKRRGFDPALSFGAFDQERLVAFTFNGIGVFDDRRTAYDTGTGTVKAYRGRGLAKAIFRHSIPYLKDAGIQSYLLEVLQHNRGAVALYKKLGFTVRREFYYYVHPIGDLVLKAKSPENGYGIQTVRVRDVLGNADYSDFLSSWQNSRESILRGIKEMKAMAVFRQGEMVAYCIYEPVTGDIASMAVSPGHRRNGLATVLLASVVQDCSSGQLKVINVPTDVEGIAAFLESAGMYPSGKQYEMARDL